MSRYTGIVSKLAQTPANPQTVLQVTQLPPLHEENPIPLETSQAIPSEVTLRQTESPENLQSGEPLKLQAGILEQPQAGIPENLQTGEPLKTQTGIPENLQINPPLGAVESPLPEPEPRLEKYSTYLESDLSVQLKLFAVSRRLKDYQVVNAALRAYLETHSR